ncbi:MAG: ribonuclease P protein component [Bacteroidales bacterium]|nr:ribonuclease P protein component [Bacteroidales bacterium]
MELIKHTLPKSERISRKLILDKIFVEGKSFVVYPIRVVYLTSVELQEAPVAIVVSVSKKRFKRAVKRNFVKRRIREAFRLNKHKIELPASLKNVAIAFLYLSTELKEFETINGKMEAIIDQLNKKLCSENS